MNKEIKELETFVYRKTKSIDKEYINDFIKNLDTSIFDDIDCIQQIKTNTNKNYLELICSGFNYYINKKPNEYIKVKDEDINLVYTIDMVNKIKDCICYR